MNPIVALAEKLARDEPLDKGNLERLAGRGINGLFSPTMLNEALEIVLYGEPPVPLKQVIATVQIVIVILQSLKDTDIIVNVLLVSSLQIAEKSKDSPEAILGFRFIADANDIARSMLSADDERYAMTMMNEAYARDELAHRRVAPRTNLRKVANLNRQAARCFFDDPFNASLCMTREALALKSLADYGVKSEKNLRRAISLYQTAARCCPDSPNFGLFRMHEATAWQRLAYLAVKNPEADLRRAITLYQKAATHFSDSPISLGSCLGNEANAWQILAGLAVDPEANLRRAIKLHQEAIGYFSESPLEAGRCLMNEAIDWIRLAELKIEPITNLLRAVDLYRKAAPHFPDSPLDIGRCLTGEANAWTGLARLLPEREACLRHAIALQQNAARCLSGRSLDAGRCLMNEANAWVSLSEMRAKPQAYLRRAIAGFEQAMCCIGSSPFDLAKTASNYARTLRKLAWLTKDRKKKNYLLKLAYELLQLKALATLERIGSSYEYELERKSFRELYRGTYLEMVEICLELAAQEPNAEQAESLRWMAWHWVQRSKARTMQESMAAFRAEAVVHDPALAGDFEATLTEFSRLERELRHPGPDTGRSAGNGDSALDPLESQAARIYEVLSRLLITSAAVEASAAPSQADPAQQARSVMAAAAGMADEVRPSVVVEFFAGVDGRLGAFLHAAGQPGVLRKPVWLEGGTRKPTELTQQTLTACDVLSRSANRRVRDAQPLTEQAPNEEQTLAAQDQLRSVAQGLGVLLAPVKQAIAENGWQEATLLLCPTGVLHLLPLAAADWDTGPDGRMRPLIAAHPLLHLPTIALAPEVASRSQSLADGQRTAYIAAADPWGKLQHIHAEAHDARESLARKGFTVESFHDDQATVKTLWEHGPSARVVHLAMHSGMNAPSFDLCGAEFHDRRFTVLELLAWLRLKQAALAVVATCSSSQPQSLEADDPSALTRAWMLAGAPSIIGSLWPLDDASARQFSQKFYEAWLGGQPLAEAVRTAVLHVREDGHDGPADLYAWAPYVLTGNGRLRV